MANKGRLGKRDLAEPKTIAEALRDLKPMGDLNRFAIDDLTPAEEDTFFRILSEARPSRTEPHSGDG